MHSDWGPIYIYIHIACSWHWILRRELYIRNVVFCILQHWKLTYLLIVFWDLIHVCIVIYIITISFKVIYRLVMMFVLIKITLIPDASILFFQPSFEMTLYYFYYALFLTTCTGPIIKLYPLVIHMSYFYYCMIVDDIIRLMSTQHAKGQDLVLTGGGGVYYIHEKCWNTESTLRLLHPS